MRLLTVLDALDTLLHVLKKESHVLQNAVQKKSHVLQNAVRDQNKSKRPPLPSEPYTSLVRNRRFLGPYSRTMPRAL